MMAIINRKTPLEKALAAVADLETTVAKWEADSAAKSLELSDLEARAGDLILDDETAAERLTGEIATLRAGVEVANRAASAARQRLLQARRNLLPVRAADLRDQAAKLKADANELDRKAEPLLKQLHILMGAVYEPKIHFGDTSSLGIPEMTKPRMWRNQAVAKERQAADLDRIAEHGTDDQITGQVAAVVKASAPATVAA